MSPPMARQLAAKNRAPSSMVSRSCSDLIRWLMPLHRRGCNRRRGSCGSLRWRSPPPIAAASDGRGPGSDLNPAPPRYHTSSPPARLLARYARSAASSAQGSPALGGTSGWDSSDRQLPPDRIEADIAGFERHTQHAARTAQKRFDPSNELRHREWFGQIIVSSGIQSRHPILDRIPRREDQNRQALSSVPRSL